MLASSIHRDALGCVRDGAGWAKRPGEVFVMKKLVMLIVVLASMCLGGCGMVYSPAERRRQALNISDYNARMLVDDWDHIWFADRPSYASYWPVRSAD